MRITNNMIRNNSSNNINKTKTNVNDAQTRLSTGKKITRPSDDPVVAVRSLRLNSTISQLSQYYEKNAKDARSWMENTADNLENLTNVLHDCIEQVNKASNKDLTSNELDAIISQLGSLKNEYYSIGSSNYAGRYIFSGFRTDTPLTFNESIVKQYENIEDIFSKTDLKIENKLLNKSKIGIDNNLIESDIQNKEIYAIKLSYDNLNYHKNDNKKPSMIWHENFKTDAVSLNNYYRNSYDISFESLSGKSQKITVPEIYVGQTVELKNEDMNYTITKNEDETVTVNFNDGIEYFNIAIDKDNNITYKSSNLNECNFNKQGSQGTTIYFEDEDGSHNLNIPLISSRTQYTILNTDSPYTLKVNSDNTYTLSKTNIDGSENIINLDNKGIVTSSYRETKIEFADTHIIYDTTPQEDIDNIYNNLGEHEFYFDAKNGEVIFGKAIAQRIQKSRINENINFIYDKNNFKKDDVMPEHLFKCNYIDDTGKTIYYNSGSTPADIIYNLGYNQNININTKPGEVFDTKLSRSIDILSEKLNSLKQIENSIKEFKENGDSNGLSVAQKAWTFMRDDLQKIFEEKITEFTGLYNKTNLALTDNGSRQKRLDLIEDRLMNQTTNFKELLSKNEDIDLDQSITELTAAQVAYEASLMAASKLGQTSLINYI